ncbi:piggyBac transposable element-derived protein 4-like [Huso huso]|uniref:PiggyBac transposable element-derived protein 4-like n=1 Tax=Huso huso TaxID=61971 RepID=A0ABR0YD59_HUSHU
MEAAPFSTERPLRWVVSADRTVEIKEEVTELGCEPASEQILQEETPPSSITERDAGGMDPAEEDLLDEELMIEETEESSDEEAPPSTSTRGCSSRSRFPACFSYDDADPAVPGQVPFRPRRPVGIDLGCLARGSVTKEMDFFQLFFTSAVLSKICEYTNAYAWRHVVDKPSYGDAHGSWVDVTAEEMLKLIGLIIYMGVTPLPRVSRYWSTAPLRHGLWARAYMCRERFKALLAVFHLVHPDEEDHSDGLQKLRYLLDHMRTTCQALYQPKRNLSIEERMVKSKGRSGMRQYIKDKPTRWGFKLWVMACSNTGYTYDFDVYAGSKEGRIYDLAKKVVLQLSQPLVNQGYYLWFDNYYTSPSLLSELRERGFLACGTYNPNRRWFPRCLKDYKTWEKKAKCGDMRWHRMEEGNILAMQWKDSRTVTVLSTLHRATDAVTIQRHVKENGKWTVKDVQQPLAIHDYNQNMGGVDKSDQLIEKYDMRIKSLKWWQTLFFHFIDIAVVNSYILFQEWRAQNPQNENLSRISRYAQLEFREELACQLGGIEKDADVPLYAPCMNLDSPKTPSSSFHADHIPELAELRRNCYLCYKRTKREMKSTFYCSGPGCDGKPFCLNKSRNCFKVWHTTDGDKYRDDPQ